MAATVLLVDDSATMRRMVRRVLETSGLDIATVEEAADGREALARLAVQQIDLVLIDVHMPVMGGIELVTHIRAQECRRRPTLVITSTDDDERIRRLVTCGLAYYLRKPFQPADLRRALAPLVGLRPAARG